MRIIALSALALVLSGCAGDGPKTPPIQPVSIGIDTFCQTIKKDRDLTWSVNDTPKTITNLRRIAATWDARCSAATKPTS